MPGDPLVAQEIPEDLDQPRTHGASLVYPPSVGAAERLRRLQPAGGKVREDQGQEAGLIREGALVVNPYFGTLRPSRRLALGEYLISDGTRNEIIRAHGRPDRLLYAESDQLVRPRGLSPTARSVTAGFWQDGRQLLLLDHRGNTLWRGTSDCQAFRHAGKDIGGPLTYCDGNDLVTLRPVHED